MFDFLTRKPAVPAIVSTALRGSYDQAEIAAMDQLGTLVHLDENTVLTTEGHVGREVIIILEGEAEVLRAGERIAKISAGDVVGETAVLTGEPRNATLIATTPVEVVVFSVNEFATLLDECPNLETKFNALTDARSVA